MVSDGSMLRTRQVLASPRRVELLEHVRQSEGPITVIEAAEALGLHPNTARLHLEQLVEVGLVEQVRERRTEPGRPRTLYTATRRIPTDEASGRSEEDYRALTSALARGFSATDDPAAVALAAGESWIVALADHAWPVCPVTAEVAAAELKSLLDELGFAPDTDLEHGSVMLRHCPCADVALPNRSVVCGVHFGMVRRTLERLDSPLRATTLEPFVTDDSRTCRIALTRANPATPVAAMPSQSSAGS